MTAAIVIASALVIAGGLLVGAKLSPGEVVSALFWPDGKIDAILVWTLRLPRSLAAFLRGAGLGMADYLL